MKFSAIFAVVSTILVIFATNQAQAKKFKIVCYFTNWSYDRSGNAKFTPANIDAKLCTHIVYSFSILDANSLTMKISDPRIDNQLYKQITAFRQKGIKVTVAIGGGRDSDGSKYGRLLTDAGARRRFIANAIEFIKAHNFQGLDLDLEYPACWHGDCLPAHAPQKAGFAQLVQELSKAFKPRGLLLSAAVSAYFRVIDGAYDVPVLAQHLDWIGVMTYDFHGTWNQKTGQNAPLFNYPGNGLNNYAEYGIKYWIGKGAPSTKIVMGVPSYGITYTLANAANHGLNAPTTGPGQAGQFTKSPGSLAYYEICNNIKNQGWTVVRNSRIGPYAFKGSQWVGYDDIEAMRTKSKYIRDANLAGAMIWTLDFDDFKGTCGEGKYPLLTALNQQIRD